LVVAGSLRKRLIWVLELNTDGFLSCYSILKLRSTMKRTSQDRCPRSQLHLVNYRWRARDEQPLLSHCPCGPWPKRQNPLRCVARGFSAQISSSLQCKIRFDSLEQNFVITSSMLKTS
jgi:hypothetical protein